MRLQGDELKRRLWRKFLEPSRLTPLDEEDAGDLPEEDGEHGVKLQCGTSDSGETTVGENARPTGYDSAGDPAPARGTMAIHPSPVTRSARHAQARWCRWA